MSDRCDVDAGSELRVLTRAQQRDLQLLGALIGVAGCEDIAEAAVAFFGARPEARREAQEFLARRRARAGACP